MSEGGAYQRSGYGGSAGYGAQPGYGGAPGYGGSQGYGQGQGQGQGYNNQSSGYGQNTYAAPQGSTATTMGSPYGAAAQNDDSSGKSGMKKSMALAALNKNVSMWAGFFMVCLFAYYYLSYGDFSFLMTCGAMFRMFGFGILNVKTFMSKRATGVSIKTLQLYCLVFFFRLTSIVRHEGYLPYDKSGDWLYHFIEVMSLVLAGSALWGCMGPFKQTYQNELDSFGEFNVPPGTGALFLAVPILLLAMIVHPTLNNDFLSDVAWTYAMYLESAALVPQLFMFQKQTSGVVELLTAHFVAALGLGRVMEFMFWVYSYHELATNAGSKLPGYLALLSQFMQLVLMLDFFWYYYQAVKNATPLVLPSTSIAGIV